MEEEEEEPGEKDCVDSVESFWQKAMASILYKIGNIENIMETNNLFEDETVLSEQRASMRATSRVRRRRKRMMASRSPPTWNRRVLKVTTWCRLR